MKCELKFYVEDSHNSSTLSVTCVTNISSFDHAPSCAMCDKRIVNKDHLERHIEEIYDSKYEHRCEVCSKWFNSMDIIDQHIFDNHGLRCTICEYTVADKP